MIVELWYGTYAKKHFYRRNMHLTVDTSVEISFDISTHLYQNAFLTWFGEAEIFLESLLLVPSSLLQESWLER